MSETYFCKLITIKQEIRNYYAHGAFSKNGEAIDFHSKTGAVPLLITRSFNKKSYSLGKYTNSNVDDAITTLIEFIENFLWKNGNEPAQIYIMESSLPLILTHTIDGVYKKAMESEEEMTVLVDRLNYEFDNAQTWIGKYV